MRGSYLGPSFGEDEIVKQLTEAGAKFSVMSEPEMVKTCATHLAEFGIGRYTGNYGNLLFLWDVLFGTARITRRLPPAYGLPEDRTHGPEPWAVQFLYPLVRSRRAGSMLGRANASTNPPSPVARP